MKCIVKLQATLPNIYDYTKYYYTYIIGQTDRQTYLPYIRTCLQTAREKEREREGAFY